MHSDDELSDDSELMDDELETNMALSALRHDISSDDEDEIQHRRRHVQSLNIARLAHIAEAHAQRREQTIPPPPLRTQHNPSPHFIDWVSPTVSPYFPVPHAAQPAPRRIEHFHNNSWSEDPPEHNIPQTSGTIDLTNESDGHDTTSSDDDSTPSPPHPQPSAVALGKRPVRRSTTIPDSDESDPDQDNELESVQDTACTFCLYRRMNCIKNEGSDLLPNST
ncbi:hypothetical protein NX059_012336 [Plenodomus lindquistii]|nr:hypothetical protein NX059_012336 [Plenodomus lindquistii]